MPNIESTKPKPDPQYGMEKPLPVGKKGPTLSKRVDLAKAAASRLRGKM